MALDRNVIYVSLPASADLSADQFRLAAVDANGRVALAGGSVAKIIGVIANKPAGLGSGAEIAIGGIARVVAGGSVAPGDWVTANAQGFAITTTTATNQVAGRAVSGEAVGSGDIFELLLAPGQL